ncbi:hypothetical protein ABL78_7938 [Leptomonas seymouri]|uniref:Uncharacterized protein n=1 Tax=Leptomonas seymouri TaxID=5684 RepID=A0A0N0P2J9_LEPSE|nr:hypothetical protein ABL78_7938 [Leptomonas seymouri]|eukprot:KPI83039.1 hypothetical protein ABL78_7938 [Leptomonas seymouri]
MPFNPYIAQHYGSSMELMPARNGDGVEEELDATVGFRRFPNAAHITHTVFRPKNAPAAAFSPPPNNITANSSAAEVSDVLVSLRLHKGLVIDNFPSRPLTPRGGNSVASLPPLLPPGRSSVGSNDSLRDRGTGFLHNWVKEVSPSGSPRSSSTSPSSSPASAPPAAAGVAVGGIATAPDSAEAPARTDSSAPHTAPNKEGEVKPAAEFPKASAQTSPQQLPATAAMFKALPHAGGQPSDCTAPSVPSFSVPSDPASNAKAVEADEARVPMPDPESMNGAMNSMLQRSREALEHVQRVLGETSEPSNAAAASFAGGRDETGNSATRTLLPPPSLLPTEAEEKVSAQDPKRPYFTTVAVGASGSASSTERSQVDSLDFVSPLSMDHFEASNFPTAARSSEGRKSSALVSVTLRGTMAVPDETRYMVLCKVSDPSFMVDQRLRRRNPDIHHHLHNRASTTASQLCERHIRAAAPPPTQPSGRAFPRQRIAEVSHRLAAAAAVPTEPPTEEKLEANPIPLSSASSSVHAAARNSTQPRKASPRPSAALAKHTGGLDPHQTLHEDPSLLQELADFLRAGNASGFSSLSAALTAPTTATATTPSATSARNRVQPQRRRRNNSRAAAPPPAPTVLLGNPPAATLSSSSSQFGRSFTPSAHLARVNTNDVAVAAATTASVSPHRSSVRPHRPNGLPSYAQPTISWLSKGSEASGDDFPVTHSASGLTSLVKEANEVP